MRLAAPVATRILRERPQDALEDVLVDPTRSGMGGPSTTHLHAVSAGSVEPVDGSRAVARASLDGRSAAGGSRSPDTRIQRSLISRGP